MSNETGLNYPRLMPAVYSALEAVHGQINVHGLPRPLHHLIQLRASQLNNCAFCVKMHTREARQDGESNERLDHLAVWSHVCDFTPAEKAALAWTEALTLVERGTDYHALRRQLREHFADEEIAALTAEVAMINLWNRINISNH